MSTGKWGEINYPKVPSYCMKNNRKAFYKHDKERFSKYIEDVSTGKEKINSATLYPMDIVRDYLKSADISPWGTIIQIDIDLVLEEQWKALPNYIQSGKNVLVMADVSGSMTSPNLYPLSSSIGLATYFAQRTSGPFANMFMTFSEYPSLITIDDTKSLNAIIEDVFRSNWDMSTNLEAAFDLILQTAIDSKCTQDEMPNALIIVSDMQINKALYKSNNYELFYQYMYNKFKSAGYTLPSVIFWNVNSETNTFFADKNKPGVLLASGNSSNIFGSILECIDKSPYEYMLHVLKNERYDLDFKSLHQKQNNN